MVKKYVRYGGSPRAMQAMILAGKIGALLDGQFNVGFRDIRAAAIPALRHRIILNFDGEAEELTLMPSFNLCWTKPRKRNGRLAGKGATTLPLFC